MENNQQLQRVQGNTPAFLRDATSSLEKMQSYAKLLADSELLPKHFYKLDQYKKPIKDAHGKLQPNVPAIIMTIQHGLEVGMSISQALQQVVPINGITSIKGDGAMALIQNSGLCVFWKEEVSGSIEKEDYMVKLHAKHKNGREKIVEFSVYDAKRLGLWVTQAMVDKNENLKHGGWWKTPKRMVSYRALGYMARDLFPEVMQGMYTEEEARDFNEDNTTFQTADGITARIDESKPTKLNEDAKAALATGSTAATPRRTPKATKAETKKEEVFQEAEIVKEEVPTKEEATTPTPPSGGIEYTKAHLDTLDGAGLLKVANDTFGAEVLDRIFDGPNKLKRIGGWLKKLILVKQDGKLEELLQKEFNLTMAEVFGNPSNEQPAKEESDIAESEVATTMFAEPGEGGRSFAVLMEIDKKREELGIENQSILDFISEQQLEYPSLEAFYRNAPSETIQVAFGLQ